MTFFCVFGFLKKKKTPHLKRGKLETNGDWANNFFPIIKRAGIAIENETEAWLHFDRIDSDDGHHRHCRGVVIAGARQRESQGQTNGLHE